MTEEKIYEKLTQITDEYYRAVKKHPHFPADPVHQVAIMAEEAGESTRASLRLAYEGGTVEELRTELVQTAAMCVRCLVNLEG